MWEEKSRLDSSIEFYKHLILELNAHFSGSSSCFSINLFFLVILTFNLQFFGNVPLIFSDIRKVLIRKLANPKGSRYVLRKGLTVTLQSYLWRWDWDQKNLLDRERYGSLGNVPTPPPTQQVTSKNLQIPPGSGCPDRDLTIPATWLCRFRSLNPRSWG